MKIDETASCGPSGSLPTVGERLTLALSLRLPTSPNLDLAATEQIDAHHPGAVTVATFRALREGREDEVTGIQRDAIAAFIGLSTEVLFGSDPQIVLPQINDLRALSEARGLEHIIQLRAGQHLSEPVRQRLVAFLSADPELAPIEEGRDGGN